MAQRPALLAAASGSTSTLPPSIEAMVDGISRHRDFALVVGILGILGLLIIPLPAFLLDHPWSQHCVVGAHLDGRGIHHVAIRD